MSQQLDPQHDFQWMLVYSTYNMAEAHIVAGRLQHEGIQAFVNYAPRSVVNIALGTYGEIWVVVHPKDYEQALAILEHAEPELPEATDDYISFSDEDDDDFYE